MHSRHGSEAPPDIADELRQRLLDPDAQRPLDLHEVQHAGMVFFGNPNLLQLYRMSPAVYHERGIRIASRTAVECAVDCSALSVAEAVRGVLEADFAGAQVSVVDLFMGSGNLLFHVTGAVKAQLAVGLERDDVVFRLTRTNFELIGFEATLEHGGYEALLNDHLVPRDQLCLVVVAPPWGTGFEFGGGLDLRRTAPPIEEVLGLVRARLRHHEVLCVVQTHELVVEESILALTRERRVHARGCTGGLPPGRNVGYLICSL